MEQGGLTAVGKEEAIEDLPKNTKRDDHFEFINTIKGGAIPKEFIKPTEKGIVEALDKGIVAGYPMVDVQVTLYDGSFHDVDSSEFAFKIAGSMAVQDGAKKAKPVILEPIMKTEVITPEAFFGPVISDLNSRRGKIEETKERAGMKVLDAMVPLSEMFGYATALRSLTEGRASFTILTQGIKELSTIVSDTKSKLDGILVWFKGGNLNIQKDVCVDEVCVTK
jgi:elongation factor G